MHVLVMNRIGGVMVGITMILIYIDRGEDGMSLTQYKKMSIYSLKVDVTFVHL